MVWHRVATGKGYTALGASGRRYTVRGPLYGQRLYRLHIDSRIGSLWTSARNAKRAAERLEGSK